MTMDARVQVHELTTANTIPPGCPLIVFADDHSPPLEEVVLAQRRRISELLLRHGAILFRGFAVSTAEAFEAVARSASSDGRLMNYVENTSPRTAVLGEVKTSTDYPPEQDILLHNEHSYSRVFPQRLYFSCRVPPARGGCTLLADCRAVLADLGPEIVGSFERKGWMYVRNFRGSFGPTWQQVFQTSSEAALEEHCHKASIQLERGSAGEVTIRHVRRAIHFHPRSGERIWFNHVVFWHISSLVSPFRELILSELGEQDYPNNTYYGDGSPIEDSVLDAIRQAYARHTVAPRWCEGDVMVLDNLLVAHGRERFMPPRLIFFAMSDPHEQGVP